MTAPAQGSTRVHSGPLRAIPASAIRSSVPEAPSGITPTPPEDTGARGDIGNGPVDSRRELMVGPARQGGPSNQQPARPVRALDALSPTAGGDLRPSVERFSPMVLRSMSYGIRDQLRGEHTSALRISGMPTAKQLPWQPVRSIWRSVPVTGANAPSPIGAPQPGAGQVMPRGGVLVGSLR